MKGFYDSIAIICCAIFIAIILVVPLGNWVAEQLSIDMINFNIYALIVVLLQGVISVELGTVIYKLAVKPLFFKTEEKSEEIKK